MYGLIGATIIMLGGWMVAQTRDDTGMPIRSRVTLGEGMAALGMLAALFTLPPTLPPDVYVAGLALIVLWGPLLVRGAGRLAIGWTSPAEVVTSAAGLAWVSPRRALWSLACLAGGLGLAWWLVGRGEPAAALLGAGVVLAPARWHLPRGYSRERARTGIERAMAGVLTGGPEWQADEANLRGAPIRVRFDREDRPSHVSFALPPAWKGTGEEALEEEMQKRLSPWGYWLARVDHGDRRVVAEAVEPLPRMLVYGGEVASVRGEVVLGMARLSRQAAKAREGRYGETLPFVWDARIAPHGLVVGSTGGGKSSTFRVIITSWCRNPRMRCILLDPKTTEFGLFRGRQGVMMVADTVESMTETLRFVEAERVRRATVCKQSGVTAVWMLPSTARPSPWLVVVDEIMDYLDKSAAQTEQAKAENDLRAEAQDLINRLDALARVGDIHLILAGQRLDRKVVDGRIQNNSPLRVLTGVAEAGSTERHMIQLTEVEPESAAPGRGVAKTVGLPECEVQLTYLDDPDLDRWLPMDDSAEREWLELTVSGAEPEFGQSETNDAEAKPPTTGKTDSSKKPETSPTDSDQNAGEPSPGQGRDPDPGSEGDPTPSDEEVMQWFE